MRTKLTVMCALLLTASVANALPERGFPGGLNEVKDSTFINYVEGSGEGGPYVPISWSIYSTMPDDDGFLTMIEGVTGYAYDHGQWYGEYSTLTTHVNAEDGNLYEPLASDQMINLSFYAHIDDGGYVIASIKWWDSIDPALFADGPEGYGALPPADHEIVLYHEDLDYDDEYRSDFTINGIEPVDGYDGRIYEGGDGYDGYDSGYDGYDSVRDDWWHPYDLFVYETHIDSNPQFMMIEIEIGHIYYEWPSSAYITDIQFFQDSGDAPDEIAVPEPATLILLGIGALAGLVRRRKK